MKDKTHVQDITFLLIVFTYKNPFKKGKDETTQF